MNEDLYKMASEFWPEEIEKERCTQFNYWEGALDFLYYVIESDVDFALIIDEDCFIFDWNVFEKAIKKIKIQKKFSIAGMPDTHINCSHRIGPDYSLNPFLLVFNLKAIRLRFKETTKFEILYNAPQATNEIFYPLFFWFQNSFWIHHLKGKDHFDETSTWVFEGTKPFAVHSWMSREFETVPEQRERILNLYNEAKILQS
jgi:hypothetical protein